MGQPVDPRSESSSDRQEPPRENAYPLGVLPDRDVRDIAQELTRDRLLARGVETEPSRFDRLA